MTWGRFFLTTARFPSYTCVMPEPVIPRTINFPPEVFQAVDEYRVNRGMKSWSKALLAMLAEWQVFQAQGARKTR